MIATQILVTPTAAVLFTNPGPAPLALRITNSTATPTVVRLSGTPTGLSASSGYPLSPSPAGQIITIPGYDSISACANPTQAIDLLA